MLLVQISTIIAIAAFITLIAATIHNYQTNFTDKGLRILQYIFAGITIINIIFSYVYASIVGIPIQL